MTTKLISSLFILSLCVTSCMAQDKQTVQKDETTMEKTTDRPQYLGGISPEEALEYMKTTPDLVVIDVRTAEWRNPVFKGAVYIPHDEIQRRYKEIPTDRPVLLHCGAGIMAPRAYKYLVDLKANIKELRYIAGSPKFSEYNKWYDSKRR